MAQKPQHQVLRTKKIYLPQRDTGHGVRNKDKEQKIKENGKELREKKKGYLSQRDKELSMDREEKDVADRQNGGS